MVARNICRCPPPSETTISCAEHEAATCYTDERGNPHGACYPLSELGAAMERDWDEMRRALTKLFSEEFRIPHAKFTAAQWISQTLASNELAISVHFMDGSAINILFPPGVQAPSQSEKLALTR